MVGEQGRIAHHDGNGFSDHGAPVPATLWGVYAFGAADVWAVGGTPLKGTMEPNDIVLHYDGNGWTQQALPGVPKGVSLFKVWGTSASDLYVVGEKGTIWHKLGADWKDESGTTQKRLFTVWGCSASEVYAVGEDVVLLTSGDGAWQQQAVDNNANINGVSCALPGAPVLAGDGGLKQRFVDGVWIDEFTVRPFANFHGAWAADNGDYWAVGGDFISGPTPNAPRDGVVARYGVGSIADAITP
jgi:hypothetical protein